MSRANVKSGGRASFSLVAALGVLLGASLGSAGSAHATDRVSTSDATPNAAPRVAPNVVIVPAEVTTDDDTAAHEELEAPPAHAPAAGRFIPRLEVVASGAVVLRSLFDVPMRMGGAGIGIGARVGEHVAMRVAFDYELGSTRRGLSTNVAEGAALCETVWGRFRLGGGFGLLRFSLARVTNGTTLAHYGVGLRVVTSFDLLQSDALALYLGARAEADWMFSGTLPSAGLVLGLRVQSTP